MGFSTTRSSRCLVALVATWTLGCGAEESPSPSSRLGYEMKIAPDSTATYRTRSKSPAEVTKTRASDGVGGEDRDKMTVPDAAANRKIIYNANIDLVTEDLTKFESGLSKLINQHRAYVAESNRSGRSGTSRHGSWKVRIPVEGYDVFVKAVQALGEPTNVRADSQDVTEEFYDLEARQTAKKVEEARLLKHLSDSTGKLDEILAVERELSRVRGEIERMQGRLRVLDNLTSLTTVTINVSEVKDYVPPEAPTLWTKVTRTFAASLEGLERLGESVLLFVVGCLPWLPLIAIAFAVILWLLRKAVRAFAVVDPRVGNSRPA